MTDSSCIIQPFGAKCPPANFLDPRDDKDLIGKFPSLVLGPPSPREYRRFLANTSIFLGEHIRYRELMRHLERAQRNAVSSPTLSSECRADVEREIGWRALHEYFAEAYGLTSETYERDMTWFVESIRAARRTIDYLLDTFFPMRLQMCLEMISEVEATSDPVQLLQLCRTRGSDSISRIQRFEARRQLTLALMEFEMRLSGRGAEQLDADRIRLVRMLEQRYFESQRSEQVAVIAELDPDNNYRVKSFRVVSRNDNEARIAPTPTRVVIPLDVRIIRCRGRDIRVYFDSRSKQHIPIKLILKRRRYHEVITDMNGYSFVFFDEEHDLADGVRYLREQIVRVPGMVSSEASNAKRAGVVDPGNPFSSSEYRATKYDVRFFGWSVEMRFMYFTYWANELFSNGPGNHLLYKLYGNLDRVFPVLFPTELFPLDWRDPELRQTLWDFQRSRL